MALGTGESQFDQPCSIAVESDDDIVIVDSGNNRIQKFNSDGDFIRKWGSYGPNDGQFTNAIGITVDSNDDIYVLDWGSSRVQKFSLTGDFIRKWGEFGTGDKQFRYPYDIASFPGNSILIADTGNDRIQEISNDAHFITTGFTWNPTSEFNQPWAATVNKTNSMHYVTDFVNNRIQRFHWDPV